MPKDTQPRARRSRRTVKHFASLRNVEVSDGHFEVSAYRFEGAPQGGALTRTDLHPDGEDIEISMFGDMVGGKITGGTFIASGTTVSYREEAPPAAQYTEAAVFTLPGQAPAGLGVRRQERVRRPREIMPPPSVYGPLHVTPAAIEAREMDATRSVWAAPAMQHSPQFSGHPHLMRGPFHTAAPVQPVNAGSHRIPWQTYVNYESLDSNTHPPLPQWRL